VEQAGSTPLFVYDLGLIDAKIARFRARSRSRPSFRHEGKPYHAV
jgi:hypothetical protein